MLQQTPSLQLWVPQQTLLSGTQVPPQQKEKMLQQLPPQVSSPIMHLGGSGGGWPGSEAQYEPTAMAQVPS